MSTIHNIDGLQFHELVSQQEIQQSVGELSDKIEADYASSSNVTVVTVLEGARPFSNDLLARLDKSKFEAVEIKASSYNGGLASSGIVKFDGLLNLDLLGKDVLILDDVYDTGATLATLIFKITSFCPKSVRVAVMLDKQRGHEKKVKIDYIGTKVPDVFLVGYGLDYDQKYRDLPFVAELKQ